jgi:membrane protein DedA with SNARE-associated domain
LIAAVAAWITAMISSGGYVSVAMLMAVESACIPLPSEIIMPFAGYLASTSRFSLWGLAVAGAIGCNAGSTVAYWIGAVGGRPFILRWGRWVLLDPGDLARAERFFARFGMAAIFIGRLLPVIRTFIALPAGISHMRSIPFQIYTFVGSFAWCYVLAYIGARLGEQWDSDPWLRSIMHQSDLVILVALLAGIAWFVWRRLGRKSVARARDGGEQKVDHPD